MRQLSIAVFLYLLLTSDNLEAQNQIEDLIQRGANNFQNADYDEAINAFNKVIQLDSSNSSAYSYLAYSWFSKLDFDSALQFLDKAIEFDEMNAELYYLRGISKTSLNIRITSDACLDFDQAISLGYSDPSINDWRSECWKHTDIILRPEGLSDSTVIDRILEVLPNNWTIFEIQDVNSLSNSPNNTDKYAKFYFTIINLQQNFIDTTYSTEEYCNPQISIAIVHKDFEDEIRTAFEKSSNNVKDGEIFSSDIIKSQSSKCLILCKWWSEHRIERVNDDELTDQYFKDKEEIIKQLKRFDWEI